MKIAFFSDIHANWEAYTQVMQAIDREAPDLVVCGGDIVNPLPSSEKIFWDIRRRKIPILRGNHEDYMLRAREGAADDPVRSSGQFLPSRLCGEGLSGDMLADLRDLPMSLKIEDPFSRKIHFCHASPKNNRAGYLHGVSEELYAELRATGDEIFVCGHWHQPINYRFRDLHLIGTGSAGLPLRKKCLAEYLILECGEKEVAVRHEEVSYDKECVLEEYRSSGRLKDGGPIAELIYLEYRDHTHYVLPFLMKVLADGNVEDSLPAWRSLVDSYFTERAVGI